MKILLYDLLTAPGYGAYDHDLFESFIHSKDHSLHAVLSDDVLRSFDPRNGRWGNQGVANVSYKTLVAHFDRFVVFNRTLSRYTNSLCVETVFNKIGMEQMLVHHLLRHKKKHIAINQQKFDTSPQGIKQLIWKFTTHPTKLLRKELLRRDLISSIGFMRLEELISCLNIGDIDPLSLLSSLSIDSGNTSAFRLMNANSKFQSIFHHMEAVAKEKLLSQNT